MLQPRHATRVPRPRRSRLRSRPVVATVALVATVGLISGAAPAYVAVADGDISLSQGDRVLQSVDIEMGPDGTLNSVVSNAVAATSDGSPSDTATDTFSPDQVVDDLPVRVVTSYRTADSAGTDLSELKGYTGKVAIDLTVQNLTVTPEDISYDVDGGSRSQAALVGVPLTVVASTTLPDVPGASVVTAEKNKNESTNGVLSQSQDGTTQVQWATILAPPQLGSSARLSLVVDAKDFTPPSFDLSVQPGLVTDTSVGALVESVFDPQASDELDLQARTIKVIGEVNEVLGRAGASISNVRTTLNASAETLGQKTVGDLESSVTEITSSMRDLDGTITGLGDDLSSTLESTGSSSIEQLQESVASVDALLGDTNARASVKPANGCNINVTTDRGSKTVYASLLRVNERLQYLSNATQQCKDELQASILTTIGSPDANEQNCLNVTSVACTIVGTASAFKTITDKFAADADAARADLDYISAEEVAQAEENGQDLGTTGVGELKRRVTALTGAIFALQGSENTGGPLLPLTRVVQQRDAAKQALRDLRGQFEFQIKGLSDAVNTDLTGLAGKICGGVLTGQVQLEYARDLVDDIFVSPPLPACAALVLPPGQAPGGAEPNPLDTIQGRFQQRITDLYDVSAALSPDYSAQPTDGESAVQAAFRNFDTAVNDLYDALTETTDADGNVVPIRQLAQDVAGQTDVVKTQVDGVLDDLGTAVDEATAAANASIDNQIQEGIPLVTEQAQKDRAAIGKAFESSANGLDAAADGLIRNGKATINAQRAELEKGQKQSANGIDKLVDAGLVQIADQVQASTRDGKAVSTLLTADLTKVLQDIGESGNGGSGLLGSLATNAATAGTADFQVALATRTTSSYANVRGQDIAGILLRQAQSEASLQAQASMEAFGIDVPTGVERRTVYTFHVVGQ